ncbi:MAG: phosphocholine cytidylyltransferase family protein [Candidatus Pacearchaeota archaeon]|nr:phosphocholine cytidylyltransferase family protein [Candidatus Pacearchaeota archaeon]
MKAIILAAGMGTRLEKYAKGLPKGMLRFNEKTLLETQIQTLRESGIDEIIVVKGYAQEMINFSGIKYFINEDYKNTNMVASLMTAESELGGEILVCYSDIIYEKRLIEKLKKSPFEVSVLVDDNWKAYWKARFEKLEEDIESLNYDEEDNIFDIGNPRCRIEECKSRYIGLIKFSGEGIKRLKEIFYKNKKKYWDNEKPWLRSKSFKKAYMTCMIQEMIKHNSEVKVIHINNGWLEFDTTQDYEKTNLWLKEGSLGRFFNF